MNVKAKRITTIAMLCALAYVVMAVGRVPVVLFLKYDPKDVVITLGGLIWGPMTACLVSVLVSVLEMFTVSDTGILGCIMNILSTCAFACTASAIYRKKRTLAGAVAGLAAGCAVMVSAMLLWNYLITPGRRLRSCCSPPFSPSICSRADSMRASPSCSTSQWSPLCGKAD